MKYLLLLSNAPDAWGTGTPLPDDGVFDDWTAYTRALHEAGVLLGGAGLAAAHTATSVQIRAGKRMLTDGPFADTKEHLIGFYVLECGSLDEAIDWAAKVPNARTGTVEVRPLSPGQTTVDTLASTGVVVSRPL